MMVITEWFLYFLPPLLKNTIIINKLLCILFVTWILNHFMKNHVQSQEQHWELNCIYPPVISQRCFSGMWKITQIHKWLANHKETLHCETTEIQKCYMHFYKQLYNFILIKPSECYYCCYLWRPHNVLFCVRLLLLKSSITVSERLCLGGISSSNAVYYNL